MKPLNEARLSVIVYQYSTIELSIINDLLEEILEIYQSFTGKQIEITSTAQGPFAAYLNEVQADLPSEEAGRSKRDFIVMVEEALNSARQHPHGLDPTTSPGFRLIQAMASTAVRSQSDVQLNYKSDQERKSVLLTRMDAVAVQQGFAESTPGTAST
ncbi:hypothetical protein [Roseomonas gilardii]|uniref:hypothetical protein n=1 Tax=Roseomonas gilardii TaxID=257708 RepID=UPI0011C07870|nr:hypothetical protein [Roseomonas gilardii]